MTAAVLSPVVDTATDVVLSVRDLKVSARSDHGLVPLVEGLSFDLHRGETLAIAGESGSGKSITSLACMGLLPAPAVRVTGGSIRFGDEELTTLPEKKMQAMRGARIAMIFQEPMTALNPVMSIGRQLVEAIRAHEPLSISRARARALEAVKAVRLSQPEKRLEQYPHELSGGMRQRVMIAMAIALRPAVLIADEPTTALDVTVQREVLDLLRDLQKDLGTAVILITHDMGVVAEMADRVIVMRKGKMVEAASTVDLFDAPQEEYTRDLLAAVPRIGTGASRPEPEMRELLVRYDDVSVNFPIRQGLLGRVAARVHAVEHVSLEIFRGETLSLVGESGCGKSTMAKALVGLVPHSGRIEINGKALGDLNNAGRKAIPRDLQIVFQDPMAALDARMTVGELIREPLVIHGIGTPAEQKARVHELLERVELSRTVYNRYPHQFSGGQRQRICIARALALKPKLIICDESVAALDVSIQAKVLDLLRDLQKESGVTYLFISHDMAVVENISDRVAVMYLGQIVEMGTRAQLFGNPQHTYTRRLLAAVPVPDPRRERQPSARLSGEIPSPVWKVGEGPNRVGLVDIGGGHLVAR
ncbi:putative peptide transport fused subunits of ABC superfamily: ATP-binding components [Pseudorhizobium banfieldiae]|uniref:Putative peptide transport fused subunits of ABC superfamily: ATP-binding components n=1 Tax=Pseudorhizobium banfieldiae TaxID=1125847 RepID=L0NAK4_9HYPH|nr:ABC transporter ATP-binding protein [Pseudorhizobium banfieldiae]CAD6600050.1 ABC transporter ATP-binding protein [arsenite-oxidising bacterium NT-25]CCF18045.1 putative peptide transport fused subunits of ABC superfamily: ATP-binding components [Pseudorhizobium banfieldiae]